MNTSKHLTIAFLNKKGGVGKTSSTHHLAGAMALRGSRVLLVDLDPQASLTQGLLGPEATESLDVRYTVCAAFEGWTPLGLVAMKTSIPGIDLVPGSLALDAVNVQVIDPEANELLGVPPGELERLAEWLRDATEYDFVLIDCPPNLQGCAWAASLAADALVIPLQPESYGGQGIYHVNRFFELVRAKGNPRLRIAGYLLNMVDRRLALHKVYAETIREAYGVDVFCYELPARADFKEAIDHRKPVGYYRRKGVAALAADLVADELVSRVTYLAASAAGVA